MGEKRNSADTVAATTAIVNRVRSICQAELAWLERRRPQIPQAERAELELMLHRIEEQIIQPVIVELESIDAREKSQGLQSLFAQLFGAS